MFTQIYQEEKNLDRSIIVLPNQQKMLTKQKVNTYETKGDHYLEGL